MPNYVKNIIRMKGIAKLPLFTIDEHWRHTEFDFNKLIPMPESLNLSSGSITRTAVSALIQKMSDAGLVDHIIFKKTERIEFETPEVEQDLLQKGILYAENILKYGYPTWYEWCIAKWGTKWNACETKIIDDDTITFETAWSNPEPILYELAKRYPNSIIKHEWADEDVGANSGEREWNNGCWYECCDMDENSAYERYIEIWGVGKCFYRDEDGLLKRHSCDGCHGCD